MITVSLLSVVTVFSLLIVLILRLLKKPLRIPGPLFIISFLLLVIGFILAIMQEPGVQYYESLKSWKRVTATVVASRVVGDRAVLPEVAYQYEIDGKRYRNKTNLDIPGFGNQKRRDQTARIIISDYPAGKEIAIITNPADPSDSRIRTSPPWNLYGRMGFGVFIFGVGMFLIFQKLISPVKRIENNS